MVNYLGFEVKTNDSSRIWSATCIENDDVMSNKEMFLVTDRGVTKQDRIETPANNCQIKLFASAD